jgi:hypothetical protein
MNIYKQALLSQGAVNLLGLVSSFKECLDEIWNEAKAKGEGTDYVNNHPVVRLFAEQIAYLGQRQDYFECYRICEAMGKG